MSKARVCYLIHKESQRKILLQHKKPKILGRNTETLIQDLFVSKQQLECTADSEKCLVSIKPLGRSISGIDGYATVKNKTYNIGHGHVIELRLGYHEFEIVFDPEPESSKNVQTHYSIFNTNMGKTKETNFELEKGMWELIDKELLIFTPEGIVSQDKIAAFDIDGTIIKTKSGKRFPINADDWEINFSVIPIILRKLHEDNYKIVFFTNQSGVGQDSLKVKEFKKKIENILKSLSVPIQVFIALRRSFYRKPMLGMWNTLIENKNNNKEIDKEKSFYVGDAAGRGDSWAPKKKKDHSNADRLFAINAAIKFYTPEEYFLKSTAVPYSMPEFDPRNLPVPQYPIINYEKPHVVIMVGGPGSGKSHFCNKILIPKGYVYVNRDQLGSWQKCIKALEDALLQRNNCVIDNTNVDRESRSKFLDVCKRNNVVCCCFMMNTSVQHCKHNNTFREITDTSHQPVSEIIINSMFKNYQEPDLNEGFREILKIPFVPVFDDKEKEKLYKMFLLEK